MSLHLTDLLRTQARANLLANRRLHQALAQLTASEFQAPRTSFFPSLALTLNHILAVDRYYLAALQGDPAMRAQFTTFVPCDTAAALAEAQAAQDLRLIAFCDALQASDPAREILLDRGARGFYQSPLAHVCQHLFMHQTHHRGQVHAMLAGTAVAPPPLDDFLLPCDAADHAADLAAVGWTSAELFPGL
jgi:uncharacterized damage-inducible protein DinB